jgi:phosphatidylglycerol:prolipoprotein diacylglycerol transferase
VVAFYLPGGLPVYLYSLIFGIGAAVGLAWIAWKSPRGAGRRHIDVGLLVLIGGLVGSRLFFAILNWSYYENHLAEIPQIYLGGLVWPGALLGGSLVLVGYVAWTGESMGAYADTLFPLFVSLVVVSWLGCWVDGCAYGKVSNAWWALPARDEGGLLSSRFPLQLLGAFMALSTFLIIDVNRERFIRPGMLALLGGFILTLEYTFLSFWRVDPSPLWLGLRLDLWVAFMLLAITGLLFAITIIRLLKTGRKA